MSDPYLRYWVEAVEETLNEMGKLGDFTKEQIAELAGNMQSSHENYGMAFGHDCIPNPLQAENEDLKRELRRERSLVVCPECKGGKRLVSHGPYHSYDSQCWKCSGKGKITP